VDSKQCNGKRERAKQFVAVHRSLFTVLSVTCSSFTVHALVGEAKMIKLQRIGHILFTVRDLERSKAFYTNILGFKVLEEDPNHGGVFLALGDYGNTLDLFPSTKPDAYPQPKAALGMREGLGVKHTAFAVETEEELTRAYFSLKDAGVPIHKALDHTSQKSIYFYDPDDNLLEIVWERPNTREIFAQGRADGDIPITFERPADR
jgi:catechol 2,3-dioxygenase-like lactoylglutathione lyase family enzyme